MHVPLLAESTDSIVDSLVGYLSIAGISFLALWLESSLMAVQTADAELDLRRLWRLLNYYYYCYLLMAIGYQVLL